MTKKPWTCVEARRLRDYAEKGYTMAAAGQLIGRTVGAVSSFAFAHKIRFAAKRRGGACRFTLPDDEDMMAPGWHGQMVEMPNLSPAERRIWREQVRQEGR